jgi:hypothetical protein
MVTTLLTAIASLTARARPEQKKADVVEHRWVFDHVGLLCNGPPGSAGLPFIKPSDDAK